MAQAAKEPYQLKLGEQLSFIKFTFSGRNDESDIKYLLGIVSFGSTKCNGVSTYFTFTIMKKFFSKTRTSLLQRLPGVYTNVKYYKNWIRENLQPWISEIYVTVFLHIDWLNKKYYFKNVKNVKSYVST